MSSGLISAALVIQSRRRFKSNNLARLRLTCSCYNVQILGGHRCLIWICGHKPGVIIESSETSNSVCNTGYVEVTTRGQQTIHTGYKPSPSQKRECSAWAAYNLDKGYREGYNPRAARGYEVTTSTMTLWYCNNQPILTAYWLQHYREAEQAWEQPVH